MRAPFAGQVVAPREQLSPGQWVGQEQPLLSLVAPSTHIIEGLVHERDLNLLATGQEAVFIAQSGEQPARQASLSRIDISAIALLPYPELGSEAGGPIAVRYQKRTFYP